MDVFDVERRIHGSEVRQMVWRSAAVRKNLSVATSAGVVAGPFLNTLSEVIIAPYPNIYAIGQRAQLIQPAVRHRHATHRVLRLYDVDLKHSDVAATWVSI